MLKYGPIYEVDNLKLTPPWWMHVHAGPSCEEDIDECRNDTLNTCKGDMSQCINTVGGHFCRCLPGYRSENGVCRGALVLVQRVIVYRRPSHIRTPWNSALVQIYEINTISVKEFGDSIWSTPNIPWISLTLGSDNQNIWICEVRICEGLLYVVKLPLLRTYVSVHACIHA